MSYRCDSKAWEDAMSPAFHWRDAYATVMQMARDYLKEVKAQGLNTAALVSALYDGEDEFTRQRIFKGLKAGAAHGLADCWRPVEGSAFGKTVTRKLWHAPAVVTCPHCHKAIL